MPDEAVTVPLNEEGAIKPPLPTALNGEMRDSNDEKQLRHGRDVHVAYKVGQYVQPPPFFFTKDKWPIPLVDTYRGGSAFLIAGGPSFGKIDKEKLATPGLLTMGLNNSVKTFRPDLWISVDDPANFIRSIWLDPKIKKFVPISHIDKPIFNSDEWKFMDMNVGDCPNVVFYKRNERFKADQYLYEDTINWGNHTNMGGGRSVLLAAMRILFLLGVRNVFLLGVDFDMNEQSKYHFEQDRAAGSIKGNNSSYRLLQERFEQVKPYFDQAGFNVFNCNPESKLKVFPYKSFDDAVEVALGQMPRNVSAERTSGLYDRKANEEKVKTYGQRAGRQAPTARPQEQKPPQPCTNCSRKQSEQIAQQVDDARTALHAAKAKSAELLKLKETVNDQATEDQYKEAVIIEDKLRRVYRRLLAIRKDTLNY